jgi:DNA-binding SARP family transcriptional activator
VTVVVAAAGYGKTTAVQRWLAGTPARWFSGAGPDLGEPPGDRGGAEGETLVLDGVDRLPPRYAPPPGTRLVLISRLPVKGPVPGWRARGLVTDVGPAELALDPAGVAAVLGNGSAVPGNGSRAGPSAGPSADIEVRAAVHELTAGWPALVGFAATLPRPLPADAGMLIDALAAPGTAAARYVLDVVLPSLPPAAQRLVRDLADLEWATEDLAQALGHRDGRRTLRQLVATGLATPGPRSRIVPLVAAVIRRTRRMPLRSRALLAAADWYADHAAPAEAVRAAAAADPIRCAQLVARYGAHLLGAGQAETVVTAAGKLPPGAADATATLWYAEARYVTGAVDDALTVYDRLAAGDGPLPAALAWRYGLIRYRHGAPDAGLSVLLRGEVDGSPDGALLLAWTAAAYWVLGDAEECGRYADRAYQAAQALGDGRCLAAAHAALALHAQASGDRPAVQAHHDRALAAAEAADDLLSIARIRTNRAASLLHEARYADALAMIEPVVARCGAVGYVTPLAPALYNEGAALERLGRLDEAVDRYERALTLYQRLRSDKVAYPLLGLGDVYRQRNRTSQARAAYEEAIRVATDLGDTHVRVHALAGLARTVAATDPDTAADLADRAVAEATGPALATARLAAGWAAAAAVGDADRSAQAWARVRRLAHDAAESARRHRDRAALAEALELSAYAAADRTSRRQALTEALAIWRDVGAEVDADRVRVSLAPTAGRRDERARATLAAGRLASAGVVAPTGPDRVQILALGRFAVAVGGRPVPVTAWQSRKARDLLRVLVARRGRAISREELAELLWAGEPADRVGHRLAVALSTVRTVLDPDRRAPVDHLIVASASSLALNIAHLTIDAETFDEYARYGLHALRAGRTGEATPALEAAERTYTGDFLEDEPYDDLCAGAREDLRATFLQVARALAELARKAGQPDDTVRYLRRILGTDPYDEPAHQELVDVLTEHGRHGEARRAHARYVAAMSEIGVTVPTTLNGA